MWVVAKRRNSTNMREHSSEEAAKTAVRLILLAVACKRRIEVEKEALRELRRVAGQQLRLSIPSFNAMVDDVIRELG